MLNVIDLFCGAGGFSQGFKECGFNILLGIDNEPHKLITYSRNIKPKYYLTERKFLLKGNIDKNINNDDIKKRISSENNLVELTKKKIVKAINNKKVDIIIGSNPCKDYSQANENKNKNPERAQLYIEFIRMVRLFHPTWFVLENVLGFFESKEGELLESEFHILGYTVNFFGVNTKDFGVPQERKRGFLIGSLTNTNFELNKYVNHKYITIKEAISDLEVQENTNELYKYTMNPKSDFQKDMRKELVEVKNHITTKHKTSTIEKIKKVKSTIGKKRIGYYTVKNYNNISGVITSEFNNPSAKGESIHPKLDRTFTAREAARLQSFPDNYVFYGSIDEVALQIGDAVPPIMSRAIAMMIKDTYNG